MTVDSLHFRIATPDDAGQVQQLVQSAFRAEDSRQEWTAHEELNSRFSIELKEILAIITNPDSAFLMATDNNATFVATIGVSKKAADRGRLFMLAVDQKAQRGGVGRQVLAYAEDYCQRTWGVTNLGLNALSTRQNLILWYIRRGYRKTGEETPFPREHFKDLVLPDDMCFVELEKNLGAVPVVEGPA
ncbi:acyl-CoA N-acyltransferase [Penicillium lagena]|uniref:acyl-CoA N-acyltransferase n=1 Tax=Penicillium lagena TaxID=94218 RepID=UPI0025424B8A|nr:acyl-CoA N-acyltransferase [Penicillium lagena]KAJ5612278.1 acyl-CoA N-acyltransferase [Penicillium lagena]